MAVPYEINGKTVMLTIEQVLDLDDEGIQELIAKNQGMEINDPFQDIKFKDFSSKHYSVPDIEGVIDPLDEEIIEEIKKEIDESD